MQSIGTPSSSLNDSAGKGKDKKWMLLYKKMKWNVQSVSVNWKLPVVYGQQVCVFAFSRLSIFYRQFVNILTTGGFYWMSTTLSHFCCGLRVFVVAVAPLIHYSISFFLWLTLIPFLVGGNDPNTILNLMYLFFFLASPLDKRHLVGTSSHKVSRIVPLSSRVP